MSQKLILVGFSRNSAVLSGLQLNVNFGASLLARPLGLVFVDERELTELALCNMKRPKFFAGACQTMQRGRCGNF
ncbi:hypothetical protein LP7551_01584 [Roseibium album]|nr:hypothetical protein LP7551_01584 [Roseibium album]